MSQLTISSLIAELTKIQEAHGNLPVIVVDADTGWRFILQAKHLEVNNSTLDIGVDYSDEECAD